MQYLTLRHWSNFQTNLTIFGGLQAKKPPKSSLKRQSLLVRKHFEIENSGTINLISMKSARYMYHLNNFQLLKSKGVNQKVKGNTSPKNTKK